MLLQKLLKELQDLQYEIFSFFKPLHYVAETPPDAKVFIHIEGRGYVEITTIEFDPQIGIILNYEDE